MFLRVLDLWVLWSERVLNACEWSSATCLYHNGESLRIVRRITLTASQPSMKAQAYFRARIMEAQRERWPI